MTMRLTIKNEDSSRIARVITLDVREDGSKGVASTKELEPGASADFLIYDTRELRVEEVQTKPGVAESPKSDG